MCSNYLPVTAADRLLTFFGVEYAKEELQQREVFPLGMAPFIRLTVEGQEGGKPALVAEDGMFGLLPHFAAEQQYGRRTYNARSETVHKLPSFRPAWEAAQRCIIPADFVFEPSYETGKAVRWRIGQEGGVPFGIAGIYRRWRDPAGGPALFTFTMLTINADTHPFYKRFHKPGDEKRMPIFLDREEYGPWLTSALVDAPVFFKSHPGPFIGEAAPLVRAPKVAGEPRAKDELLPPKPAKAPPPPAPPPPQGDLF
jgi:putative SOS response-associated peptidase YedK